MKLNKKVFTLSILTLLFLALYACNGAIKKASNNEFKGIVASTGTKIFYINNSSKAKLIYNGDNEILNCNNSDICFLKYISDDKYKLCSINIRGKGYKELSNTYIKRYDYKNKSWILYDDNNSIVRKVKCYERGNNYINEINDIDNALGYVRSLKYKGWVYYTDNSKNNIYKKSKDGKVIKKLNNENSIVLAVINNYVLYQNDQTGELFRINTDGTNKVRLSSRKEFNNHIDDYYKGKIPIYQLLFLDKNNIYFNLIYPDGGSGTLFLFSKTSIESEKVEVLERYSGASEIIIRDGWAYYQETTPFTSLGVRRINLNSGKIEVLDDNYMAGEQSTEYYIVGKSIIHIYGGEVYKMNLDGSKRTRLFCGKKGDTITDSFVI